MATCDYRTNQIRKLCVGDLDRIITIVERSIRGSMNKNARHDIQYIDDVYCMIRSTRGVTVLDGQNTQRNVTHSIGIRFVPGLSTKHSFIFDNYVYEIVNIENLDERSEFLVCDCIKTGTEQLRESYV
jgi:head-tail adaptor